MPPATVLEAHDLKKIYHLDGVEVRALDGVSVTINQGEYVAVVGKSGSGKSTLMHIMGCLDKPTSGQLFLAGQEVSRLKPTALAKVRNHKIGFVFQTYNLLPRTKALENVTLPLVYAGVGKKERYQKAREMLTKLGLGDRLEHTPNQLSGGQQQRVAIARALINNPSLLLADEPTGNVDSHSGEEIIRIFEELHHQGHTIVIVTHDEDLAQRAQRIIRLEDGKVTS